MKVDRRILLSGLAATSVLPLDSLIAAPPAAISSVIADYVRNARVEDLPERVRKEVVRTFVNWMGVTIGGSRHESVGIAIAALRPFFGRAEADLVGRAERIDVLHAALINGIASHVLDFDDTHLKTIIHPAGPVVSAILPLAQRQKITGVEFLHALALGIEIECRIGNAIYPSHYDAGWHITGSCGVFGSTVAAGKLLGLDTQQLTCAIGIAASQPVGLKVQFGTMTKSFHVGRAAQNGLVAAMLAANGFTSDGKIGRAHV